ncbi:hypothetical protein JVX92_14005 [Microbacterium hominis]|uniref:hypothetical protein n=1 Tax=Microbacterium hominis TaxID=162426 RepID=UPI0019634F81|nr:hypothetical protein [Microbacterium hominis]QRY40572.1 hypothetical protein JVX92_14005 [Microbacterium hominis]
MSLVVAVALGSLLLAIVRYSPLIIGSRRLAASRHRRKEILQAAAVAFLVALAGAETVTISFYQALFADVPWAPFTYILHPWMRDLAWYGAPIAILAAAVGVSIVWRTWPQIRRSRPPKVLMTYFVLLACLLATAVPFGQANEPYRGIYAEPPWLYFSSSPNVSAMDISVTVGDGSAEYPTGGATLNVRLTGPPNSSMQFMMLGEKYFAHSAFTSSDGLVQRTGRGGFLPGGMIDGSCVPDPQSNSTEWHSAGDVYLPIVGALTADAQGVASTTLQFSDSHEWYTLHGGTSAVHLPRVVVARPYDTDCAVGTGGYIGDWAWKEAVTTSLRSGADQASSARVVDTLGLDMDVLEKDNLTLRDLRWTSSGIGAASIIGGYAVESSSTLARSQTLLLFSSLAGGLALGALLQLVWAWPPGVPSKRVIFMYGAQPRRGKKWPRIRMRRARLGVTPRRATTAAPPSIPLWARLWRPLRRRRR